MLYNTNRSADTKRVRHMLQGNPRRFRDVTRLSPSAFTTLVGWLEVNTALSSSRYILIDEKVLIFLQLAVMGHTMRSVGITYHHSTRTIHQLVARLI